MTPFQNGLYVSDYEFSRESYEGPFMFLGRSNGLDGWNYFVNNEYPSDADQFLYTSYTRIRFTRRKEIFFPGIDTPAHLIADGEATGYLVTTFSSTDPSKYVHRLDFTLRFEGLPLYK